MRKLTSWPGALGIVLSVALATQPAFAQRRVAVDIGIGSFDITGIRWDTQVNTDVRNDGCLSGPACAAITLPFSLNIGGTSTNQVFIYENGIASFGQALPSAAFTPLGALTDLVDTNGDQIPVFAPLYADLNMAPVDPASIGDVFYDEGELSFVTGDVDFTGPPYSESDALNNRAFRITWYGGLIGTSGPRYYGQIEILSRSGGNFDLVFGLGFPGATGYPPNALGGIAYAGFSDEFTSATVDPSGVYAWEFRSGAAQFVGNVNPGGGGGSGGTAVSEPAPMLALVTGLIGLAAIRRRARRA